MESAKLTKKVKPITESMGALEMDLSHIPLKENHADLPLWVGDIRKKYYYNSSGRKTENFEIVYFPDLGGEPVFGVFFSAIQRSL